MIAYRAHRQTWVFLFDPADPREVNLVLRRVGRYAADRESPFTWGDAARVALEVNEAAKEARAKT
jgi:hypothetical protein